MYFSQEGEGKHMSRPAVKVAIAGMAVGFIVMLLTLAIALGFKQEVRKTIIGFGSHIQVVNFDTQVAPIRVQLQVPTCPFASVRAAAKGGVG